VIVVVQFNTFLEIHNFKIGVLIITGDKYQDKCAAILKIKILSLNTS